MSSYSDPLRADMERWRREAGEANKARVRANAELQTLRSHVLQLRAAGGALAALVADLGQGEGDAALGRIVDEALERWADAEVAVTADPDETDSFRLPADEWPDDDPDDDDGGGELPTNP